MITEIEQERWSGFFRNLNRVLEGCEAKIEVLSADMGAQTLTPGLPFGGVTLEADETPKIEFTLGADAESHMTHIVERPVRVIFEDGSADNSGILDIEDAAGSKTLVTFVQAFRARPRAEFAGSVGVS